MSEKLIISLTSTISHREFNSLTLSVSETAFFNRVFNESTCDDCAQRIYVQNKFAVKMNIISIVFLYT